MFKRPHIMSISCVDPKLNRHDNISHLGEIASFWEFILKLLSDFCPLLVLEGVRPSSWSQQCALQQRKSAHQADAHVVEHAEPVQRGK